MKVSNSSIINNHHHDWLIVFTTPENYASRLSPLIQQRGWTPIWCPTITTKTKSSSNNILHYLISSTPPLLNQFSALAFTSRSGISAFSNALLFTQTPPLSSSGETFTICALGKDSELIDQTFIDRICSKPNNRINTLVPQVATPAGLVESLGFGHGRKVLCPVPLVVGLEEPLVVPIFLRALDSMGWVAVRVDAYETRWLGDDECAAAKLVVGTGRYCDAIVFTSTCEVQGLLKSLQMMGLDWGAVVKRNPGLVVAAHGPVTAAGAKSLGVNVDVVSKRFESFHGVVDALAHFWNEF